MNLLYVSLNIGDLGHGAGGWVRTVNILKELSKKDIKIKILTTNSGYNLISREIPTKLNFIILKKKERKILNQFIKLNNRFAILLNWFLYIIEFFKNYKKIIVNDYDVVYSDSDFFIDIIPAMKISNLIGKPVGCIIHHLVKFDNRSFFNFKNLIYNFGSKIFQIFSFYCIKKLNFIFIYQNSEGKKIKEYFKKKYDYQGNFYEVTNGINTEVLKKYLKYDLKKYDNSILFYGAARRNKGFFDIIDLLIETKKLIPNVVLRVGGLFNNYEKQYFFRKIYKYGLEKNIKFLGYMSEKQKFENIVKSNVVIFPSYEEGWGISIMESRYLNENIICYDILSLYSLHKENIHFVKLGDKKNFALKMTELLILNRNRHSNTYLNKYDWSHCADLDYKYFMSISHNK